MKPSVIFIRASRGLHDGLRVLARTRRQSVSQAAGDILYHAVASDDHAHAVMQQADADEANAIRQEDPTP